MNIGIYIHFPFCIQKCIYCDFYSVPLGINNNEDIRKIYFEYLKKELLIYKNQSNYKISSIYFGGGTPSLCDADLLNNLLVHL